MHFALICADKPDGLALRMETRAQHLEWLRPQIEAGRVVFGGPFLNEAGEMTGSLLVLDVADRAEAEALAASDPYAKAGLFSSAELKAWKWVAGKPAGKE